MGYQIKCGGLQYQFHRILQKGKQGIQKKTLFDF